MQKTKKFRRLLAALLAVLMLSVCIPAMAFATDEGSEQRIVISFNRGEGTWPEGSAPEYDVFSYTLISGRPKDGQNTPDVVAPEGMQFVGWTNTWNSEVLPAGGFVSFEDAKATIGKEFTDAEEQYISYTAKFEPVDPDAGKTLKIHWAIDDTEGAHWKLYDEASRTETIAWADRGNTLVMPEIVVEEGYELAGWSVSGTQSNYWDPETTTFGLTGLIVENEEGGEVAITAHIVKKEEQEETSGKTLKIHWAIDDTEGAHWKLYDEASRTETIAWADRGNTLVMPEIVVEEGYELAGWSVSGTQSNYWDPETTTFGLTGLIVENEEGGEVAITAHIVKKEEQEETSGKTLKIHWAIDDTEGAHWKLYDEASRTETIAWADRGNTFVMPEIVVEDGYELAGWTVSGTQPNYWGPETTTFGLTGLIVENEEGGEVAITAHILKKEQPEEVPGKTLKIFWAIDNADAAHWELYDGNARTETIAWADRGNTFVMPKVVVEDGYELAGWSVSGTQGNYWDANTYNFGLTGLIVEDEAGGYVSITANIVKKGNQSVGINFYDEGNREQVCEDRIEVPADATTVNMSDVVVPEGYELLDDSQQELQINDGWVYVGVSCKWTLKIYWAIDSDQACFANGNEASWTQELTWKHVDDEMAMPEITVNDGYKLNGWKVSGANDEFWTPDLLSVKDLSQKCAKDDNGGSLYVTANIVPASADPTTPSTGDTTGNNNTTTVTSTGTTADNTVVKSDAPANNTAKVLPQTGVESNAPVIGFVVVLLAAMGGAAGYLFVVRKKLN